MGEHAEEAYQNGLNELDRLYRDDPFFREEFDRRTMEHGKEKELVYCLDNCGDGYEQYCMICAQPECMKREKYSKEWEKEQKEKKDKVKNGAGGTIYTDNEF